MMRNSARYLFFQKLFVNFVRICEQSRRKSNDRKMELSTPDASGET